MKRTKFKQELRKVRLTRQKFKKSFLSLSFLSHVDRLLKAHFTCSLAWKPTTGKLERRGIVVPFVCALTSDFH